MELGNYLQILRRRKWIVIITTTVTLLVVSAATFLMTPVYSTSTMVRIAQVQDRSVDYFDLNYTMRLINTYVELVRSRTFLEETIRRLELGTDPKNLARVVKVESLPDTELLRITAESTDPLTAMQIANTLGQLLTEEGEKLYSGQGKSARELILDQLLTLENELGADREKLHTLMGDELDEELSPQAQDLATLISLKEQTYGAILDSYESARLSDASRANSVTVVEPAALPDAPSGPNIELNLVLATALGLAGGIGLAFVAENLDHAIYSPEDLEESAQAHMLGSIPSIKVSRKIKDAPLLLQPNGRSSAGEAFRILRSNVLTLDFGRPPRTLLVTSLEEDAGVSTVLANLAVAIAQFGQKVVAVDSNFRSPALDKFFHIQNDEGLKNTLAQQRDVGSMVRETKIPGVSVLPSGPSPHNPAELLGIQTMREMVGDLASWADLVLLDSPPLLRFADAVVLAPMVDSVLLVVGPGKVSNGQVQNAVAQLVNVGAERIGYVFNRVERGDAHYRYQ